MLFHSLRVAVETLHEIDLFLTIVYLLAGINDLRPNRMLSNFEEKKLEHVSILYTCSK